MRALTGRREPSHAPEATRSRPLVCSPVRKGNHVAIALVINCELCGLSVQGDTEPEVLEKASEHFVDRHPDAADKFSTEALRSRIEQV
jgi:predicted small metal-binding protein